MTFVKNHLGLILPLFAILFALEYLLVFDRAVRLYEEQLKDQYTLIVVADKGLDPSAIRNANVLIASVEPVDSKRILKRIREQIHTENLKKLEEVLPAFFTLKLRRYPDPVRLEKLRKDLLALPGVKRVQLFEKVHDRLYAMLLFLKSNFYIFGALVALIGVLLVMKQMLIWQLEHRERMQIMALFGAPVWLRSGVLFRLAIVDALIAVALVLGTIYYLSRDPYVTGALNEMGIDTGVLWESGDLIWLFATGLGISLFAAGWVVARFREEL